MYQSDYFVDKTTGTFADTLTAFGLAVVLRHIQRGGDGQRGEVQLEDAGPYLRLHCTPAIEESRVEESEFFVPIPFIRTLKNMDKMPPDLAPQAVIEYEVEREKRAEFFDAWNALPTEARRAWGQGKDHQALQTLPSPPHEDWDIFRAINPAGLIGYNNVLACWWQAQTAFPDLLRVLLRLFANTPNDMEGSEKAWKSLCKQQDWDTKLVSASQIFNPAQGKGQNRAKADKLSMGNVKTFWLPECLKAVGLYQAALTKKLRGVKDRKSYVLAPRSLDLSRHERVMHDFRRAMAAAETAVRSDVLASLRYTGAFLKHTQERQEADLWAQYMGSGPCDFVSGLYMAFYKDLGNAVATMNLSFINLPGWVRGIQGVEDVAEWLKVLEEHERIVRQFDESHSDAYNLLLLYRDFLSGNDLRPFFEFTIAYSGYIIGQRERPGGRARQFTTTNLRRLIMSSQEGPRLSKILETPGFQNIAYAIRQATVTAQYRKTQGDRKYDVRYGLGQQLARKAAYPKEFIAELADFLAKYNAESAQVMENRPGPYRRSIRTSDIDDIVALVDEFGDSRLICNLLVAYGYARVPREEQEDDE